MKIKVVSDLHLDFQEYTIPFSGEDLLIIAGDSYGRTGLSSTVDMIEKYLKRGGYNVIMVLGNHDYYSSTKECSETIKWWENVDISNFHFLHNNSIIIDNITFFGGTMWTNAEPMWESQDMDDLMFDLNDYWNIKTWNLDLMRKEHELCKNALRDTLKNCKKNNPVVVITHHLPCEKSVSKKYKKNKINPLFHSTDLQEYIKDDNVVLWVHGHTHDNCDYKIHGTRVVCNPRGYVRNGKVENINFNDAFMVNV